MAKTTARRKLGRYGWVPDLPDTRDHVYSVARPAIAALPTAVDLTDHCPPVYDQGRIGSCTANAIAAAFEFDLMKQAWPTSPRRGYSSITTNGRWKVTSLTTPGP